MRKLIITVIMILLIILNIGCEAGKKSDSVLNNASTETIISPTIAPIQTIKDEPGFYFNSKYLFSIHFPEEWIPSDESPAGDGEILYNVDGNDIRVYGGYIIDDSIEKQLEDYKSQKLKVIEIITDQGQKGTLVSGKYQDKVLFNFIICGKELQSQLYALVTPEYFEKNKAILLKSAKTLLLDEKPVLPDLQSNDRLNAYKQYLSALPTQHIRNVALAEEAYNTLKTKDKNANDQLFRLFRKFNEAVINEVYGYYSSDGEIYGFTNNGELLPGSMLALYGMKNNWSESGNFIAENPEYLTSHFASALTNGLKEYLSIREKQYEKYPATYLIEDAALSISWNQLSDNIMELESYISKYSNYDEAKEAKEDLDFYLELYLLDFNLDNTPMFEDGILTKDLQSSYLRFVKQNKNSMYFEIVQGYYDILKKNGFRLTQEAVDFLVCHGIKLNSE